MNHVDPMDLCVYVTLRKEISLGWIPWQSHETRLVNLIWEVTGVPEEDLKSVTITYEGSNGGTRAFGMSSASWKLTEQNTFIMREEEVNVVVNATIRTREDKYYDRQVRGRVRWDEGSIGEMFRLD